MNEYWKAVLIRAIRTMAQTAVALIGTTAVVLSDVDWQMVISASILAGIVSVLMAIATGLPEVQSAKELTDDEAKDMPKTEYEEDPDYDPLYIDETVDEDDDDEME